MKMLKKGLLLLSLLVLFSCSSKTPFIKDENGNKIPGSIATIEKITIGGIKQTIIIRAKQSDLPVLLFLHGGPGMPEGGMIRKYLPHLEKKFIVVDWEQRGSGLTGAEKTPLDSLTIERMTEDTLELTEILRKRFSQDKIILFAHSFGTVLGTYAVKKRPDFYHCYIPAGMIVNQVEAEKLGYAFCVAEAEKRNDTKALLQLRSISFPSNGSYISGKYPTTYEAIGIQRTWLGTYGGVAKNPDELMDMMMSCVLNKEHPFLESLKFMKRFTLMMDTVWPQIMGTDFNQVAGRLEVPTYIIAGKYDMDTVTSLVKSYYDSLVAPEKRFLLFEKSAHLAPFEEPGKFMVFMDEIAEKYPAKQGMK